METFFDRYQRPVGKQHTYDIEYWRCGYRITLNGKELKKLDGVIHAGGNVGATEAFLIHAQSAILHLSGMEEE